MYHSVAWTSCLGSTAPVLSSATVFFVGRLAFIVTYNIVIVHIVSSRNVKFPAGIVDNNNKNNNKKATASLGK